MLSDAGAPVLVTQQALLERLPVPAQGSAAQPGATIVRLDADWPLIARQPATAPAVHARPAQPRLCDLHVRLDRNTKSRRRRASWHSQSRCRANRKICHHF